MKNTTKPYAINIGNVIVGSIDGFTKVRTIRWKRRNGHYTENCLTNLCLVANEPVDILFHGNLFYTINVREGHLIKML